MNRLMIKVEIYFLSLALLFILLLCKTITFPFDLHKSWAFTGWSCRLIISLICIFLLLVEFFIWKRFHYSIQNNNGSIPVVLKGVKSKNYEYLTFMTTYIIPLVCFNTEDIRDCIILAILLFILGVLFIKTNVYYENPTLALLGFSIYVVDIYSSNKDKADLKEMMVLSRNVITEDTVARMIDLDKGIMLFKPVNND